MSVCTAHCLLVVVLLTGLWLACSQQGDWGCMSETVWLVPILLPSAHKMSISVINVVFSGYSKNLADPVTLRPVKLVWLSCITGCETHYSWDSSMWHIEEVTISSGLTVYTNYLPHIATIIPLQTVCQCMSDDQLQKENTQMNWVYRWGGNHC